MGGGEMDATVTRAELLERLKASVGVNYLTISSVFTGVTLFVAADTLTRFVTATSFPWELLPLWLTGFLIMIFAYGALTMITNIAVFEPSWRDHTLPLMNGVAQFLLFTLPQSPTLIVLWYLVAALAGGSGVGIAEYVSSHIKRSSYAPDVLPIAREFGRGMRRIGLYISSNALTLLLAYALLLLFPPLRPWQWVFGSGAMLQLIGGLYLLERVRQRVIKALSVKDARKE
jgi:hypothetical protein